MAPLARYYEAGKRFGDYFNEKYFSLDEEGRRRWDSVRILHHGAIGHALTTGALIGLAATDSPRMKRALSATMAVGIGLMESDAHDRDRWWTEGKLLTASAVLFAPLRRNRGNP